MPRCPSSSTPRSHFLVAPIQERAKQGVVVSIRATCAFVVYGVARALAPRASQTPYLGGLPANDIVAALAVGAMSLPIARGASVLAGRLFPDALAKRGPMSPS